MFSSDWPRIVTSKTFTTTLTLCYLVGRVFKHGNISDNIHFSSIICFISGSEGVGSPDTGCVRGCSDSTQVHSLLWEWLVFCWSSSLPLSSLSMCCLRKRNKGPDNVACNFRTRKEISHGNMSIDIGVGLAIVDRKSVV